MLRISSHRCYVWTRSSMQSESWKIADKCSFLHIKPSLVHMSPWQHVDGSRTARPHNDACEIVLHFSKSPFPSVIFGTDLCILPQSLLPFRGIYQAGSCAGVIFQRGRESGSGGEVGGEEVDGWKRECDSSERRLCATGCRGKSIPSEQVSHYGLCMNI